MTDIHVLVYDSDDGTAVYLFRSRAGAMRRRAQIIRESEAWAWREDFEGREPTDDELNDWRDNAGDVDNNWFSLTTAEIED